MDSCKAATTESEKLMQWKIKRLLEKQKDTQEYWLKESVQFRETIGGLEKKLQALQAELKTREGRENELREKLMSRQNEVKNLVTEKEHLIKAKTVSYQNNLKIKERFEKKMTDDQQRFEKTVAQRKQEHEEEKVSIQAANEDRMRDYVRQRDRMLEELAQQHQCKIKQLMQEKLEKEKEYKGVVDHLEKDLKAKEAEIKRKTEQEEKQKADENFQRALFRQEYVLQIRKLNDTIKDLQGRENLREAVNNLKKTVEEKNTAIARGKKEIAAVKKEKKDIIDCLSKEQRNTAVLKQCLNQETEEKETLKDEKRVVDSTLKKTSEELHVANKQISDLKDTVQTLRFRVRGTDPLLCTLKDNIGVLQTTKKRFEEDLQGCMSLLDEPKELKKRVILLKKRYINDDKAPDGSENSIPMHKHTISCVKKTIPHYIKIQEIQQGTIKKLGQRIESNAITETKKLNYFIQLVNKQDGQIAKLKEELKETNQELIKANMELKKAKPIGHKVSCWIKKRVFGKNKASTEVAAEEPPSLHPDEFEAPDCPEENITSSVHQSTDEETSSSLQPDHLMDDKTIIHVKPFVDDGLPPVDL